MEQDIINKIKKFREERGWTKYHSPSNLSKSIVIESAELLEIFQWNNFEYDEIKNNLELKEKISDELADILIYLISFSEQIEADIEQIILDKLIKNELKYPCNNKKL